MPIELGIATPAVPRDPRALDDRFGKWAADLGVTVIGTHLGPTSEDVAPHAAELRERLAGWGLRIVQATGYNPLMVGEDDARRAADLDRLTRSFEVAPLLGREGDEVVLPRHTGLLPGDTDSRPECEPCVKSSATAH